jgi:phospholipase/carboxylesterase
MSTTPALSHIHRFVPASQPDLAPILLLHGTGGDENDLLPLGRMLAPGAALLSPRGKVSEGGLTRFFRRFAEGVFDEEDVRRRADELARFIAEARQSYELGPPIAVGLSNGANIAAAVLMRHPAVLTGAVLLRAMTPLEEEAAASLAGKSILMLSGSADPIAPVENAARLAAILNRAGAAVDHRVVPAGHGLVQADIEAARQWLKDHARPGGPSTAGG